MSKEVHESKRPPFHFTPPVKDLESTRQFYGGLLGCPEGRCTDTWIDFDFFGHQISCHKTEKRYEPLGQGHVDNVEVPIPHSGVVLPREQFDEIAARLHAAGVRFLIPPTLRYPGKKGEQMTMFFYDPSGNPWEFKAFTNPNDIYAK